MKDFDTLEEEFMKAYKAWVATRPLMDDMDDVGYVASRKIEVRSHAWRRYVVARDELHAFAVNSEVKH